MKDTGVKRISIPSSQEIAEERERLSDRNHKNSLLRRCIYLLVIVAAAAVFLAMNYLPSVQIAGDSMEPGLHDGDVILLIKADQVERGDLCVFSYQDKLLVKRVIGEPGDVIDIDRDGVVTVNGEVSDEPYVDSPTYGSCNITLPYQVPDNSYFVLGDHRSVSIDSRYSGFGCVETDQIVGRGLMRIWPLNRLSRLS